MIRQRLNRHTTLYLGSTNDPQLQVKGRRDRIARMYNIEPPLIYHISNIQSRPPRTEHMPLMKHNMPIHYVPEARGYSRHVRGSSLYNQELHRQIRELSRLTR